MLMLHVLLSRIVNPIVWRLPGRPARMLFSFAHAEAGSRLDLLTAARLTPSVERRALYLQHANDEARHAMLFELRSAELRRRAGCAPLGVVRADSESLFERLGELRFLAFVHAAEGRGRRQFEGYRAHFARTGDDRMRALFDAVLADERRHEAYTGELLLAQAGGAGGRRRALRRAALWEAWRTWRRAGRAVAGAAYVAIMTLLFPLLAPLALLARLGAPRRDGWRER